MPMQRSKEAATEARPPESARYPLEVFYSDDDGGFIAIAKDLPGCSAFGKTQAYAVSEIQRAIDVWQQAAKAAGNPVPLPSRPVEDADLPSGKILLRVPRTLHASLIECAKKESVSLNQHLVAILSVSVGMTLVRAAQHVATSMQETQHMMTTAKGARSIAAVWIPEGTQSMLTGGAAGSQLVKYLSGAGTYIGQGLDQTESIVHAGERMDVIRLRAGRPVVVEDR